MISRCTEEMVCNIRTLRMILVLLTYLITPYLIFLLHLTYKYTNVMFRPLFVTLYLSRQERELARCWNDRICGTPSTGASTTRHLRAVEGTTSHA